MILLHIHSSHGQPIKYYEQFLKPIHDVLAALKYVWNNNFNYILDGCFIRSANLSSSNVVNSPSELIDALGNETNIYARTNRR